MPLTAKGRLSESDRAESRRLAEAIRNAAVTMRAAETATAAKGAAVGEKPSRPVVAMVTTAAVIGTTFAPAIHDFALSTLSEDVGWTLSLLLGGTVGTMLVWGLVAEGSNAPQSSRTALWGGILVGVGFAILRLSVAEDLGEVLFALGWSVAEAGTIIFADWFGARHRRDVAQWHQRGTEAAEASAQAEAGRTAYERLLTEKASVDDRIEAHLTHADERRELSGDFSNRETAYIQAACAGYRDGIAQNIGRAQGMSMTPSANRVLKGSRRGGAAGDRFPRPAPSLAASCSACRHCLRQVRLSYVYLRSGGVSGQKSPGDAGRREGIEPHRDRDRRARQQIPGRAGRIVPAAVDDGGHHGSEKTALAPERVSGRVARELRGVKKSSRCRSSTPCPPQSPRASRLRWGGGLPRRGGF